MKKQILLLPALAVVLMTNAWGAGFEKVVNWSGKHAGTAGAAVSNVMGAESLYFNPAGLAAGKGSDASFNFSPTFAQYSGPFAQANSLTTQSVTTLDSARKFSPVFGVVADYKAMPNLGIGIGAFVSGGTKAIFESVPLGTLVPGLSPEIKSDLAITEFSAGAGYELIPGLRLGVAWRAILVRASLASAAPATVPAPGVATVAIDDLSANRYNGFRVGAQYTGADDRWGLGANWRTEVQFTAKGTSSGKFEAYGSPNVVTLPGGDVYVTNTFPTQITLGGFYDVSPKTLRLIAEYAWTRYSVDQSLQITGPLAKDIAQNWQNMTNVRVGVECVAVENYTLRAGYAYTSEVTPKSSARPTFSSPGIGTTVTLGAGTAFGAEKSVEANLALEYSTASGTVVAEGATPGDYKTTAYDVHTGVGVHF